jgi:hypothetical protein
MPQAAGALIQAHDDAPLQRDGDRISAVIRAELGKHIPQMRLDRLGCLALLRNLPVGPSSGHMAQDLDLSRGQRLMRRVPGQRHGDLRQDGAPACMNGAYAIDQLSADGIRHGRSS